MPPPFPYGGNMYEIITLPNGVRIACEHIDTFRSAAVGIWVGVGSRMEKRGEEGSAHFIEHMLFKGTAHSSAEELAGRMDAIGGQVNAFTTRDSTCFYARVLDSHLKEASDILTEMFFDSLFRQEDVENERGVVLEEIDMYRDTPEDLVVEQLMAKVFPGPLGKPVLGKTSSLQKMTGDSLRAFKDREYAPDRIVVSLCGSFTDKDVQHLSDSFMRLSPQRGKATGETAYTCARVYKRKATEQNHICMTWPGLSEGDEERFAMQVMSMILGGGMSSRLFQTVRERNGLCYSIGSFTASYKDTGLFGISTAVGKDAEEKALRLIRQEVDRFASEGVAPQELERARELLKSGVVLSMESTASRMNRLGSSILHLGYCLSQDEVLDRYNEVTADAVSALANQVLQTRGLGFSALGRLAEEAQYEKLLTE